MCGGGMTMIGGQAYGDAVREDQRAIAEPARYARPPPIPPSDVLTRNDSNMHVFPIGRRGT